MHTKLVIAGVIIVVAAGSFYGGTVYAKSRGANRSFGQGAALQFSGRAGMGGMGGRGNFTGGQILSFSDGTLTIKELGASNTELVLIGSSTQIFKTAQGSGSDLVPGAEVVVTGSQNSDGSLTAQSIQIRPAGASNAPMMRASGYTTQ